MNAILPDLTISIVTGGNCGMVCDFLKSVKKHTASVKYETIILEYKKIDNTEEMIAKEFPEVVFLHAPQVRGYGQNHNDILRRAKGRYLAVLNDDMILENDALGILARYMDAHPEVGVAGAQLLNPDGSIQPSSYVSFSTPVSELTRMVRLDALSKKDLTGGKSFPTVFGRCSGNHDKPHNTAHIMGSCMVFRREVFLESGGFDERFFLGYEDQDICRRIRLKGHKVFYLPEARITHLGHKTVGKTGSSGSLRMIESRIFYHDKWNSRMGSLMARLCIAGQALQVMAAALLLRLVPGKKDYASSELNRAIFTFKKAFTRKTDN